MSELTLPTQKERFTEGGHLWTQMPESEKVYWKSMAQKALKKYEKEMEKFLQVTAAMLEHHVLIPHLVTCISWLNGNLHCFMSKSRVLRENKILVCLSFD
jgi:hypothetical protein